MYILAFFAGMLNGTLGCGGGMLALIFLEKLFDDRHKAIAAIPFFLLPVTAISVATSKVFNSILLPIICLGGIFGGFCGNLILSKIPEKLLGKIFAFIIIIIGVKTLV